MSENHIGVYNAWDLPTRLFHWINFLCVFLLSVFGLIMLNKGAIGISGSEASIGLKTTHVLIGYVFAINLLVRIILGFFGNRHSSWRKLLPGKHFKQELKAYNDSVKSNRTQTFIGHNPKGRLSVLVMLILMVVIMTSGLIRAATDIYYPPFGKIAAGFVAEQGIDAGTIKPYDKTGTNPDKYQQMQSFKRPVGTIHLYGAYALWVMILIHIFAVIRTESAGNGSIVSAMFSGRKYLPRKPADE